MESTPTENNKQLVSAILIAGVLIAGAILLKGSNAPTSEKPPTTAQNTGIQAVSGSDHLLGDPKAPVTLIMYEDFQCPWCGKFDAESEQTIRNKYLPEGKVNLVYRDFAFLGEESYQAAEAAWCANDQGKFWQYHDYLFTHQDGENRGTFADANLKTFAKDLGLDTKSFNTCFDKNTYAQEVIDSKTEGKVAGVKGTPHGFILRDGRVVDQIEGYMTTDKVLKKIDAALK